MHNDLLIEIGQRLFERRKQLRFTQEDLAEKANVTSQMISNAELGKKAMRPENIIKLCSVLGISTDYLLNGVINDTDISLLKDKLGQLQPVQFRHFEDIANSFVAVCTENRENK